MDKIILPVRSKELLTEMNKMSSDEKELLDKKPKQANKFRDEVMEVFEKYNVKDELALHVGLKMLRGERRLWENKNENANRTNKED